jgi:hypothetical protein
LCVRAKVGDEHGAWPPRSPIADKLQQYENTADFTCFFAALLTYWSKKKQSLHNWWSPELNQNWQNHLGIDELRTQHDEHSAKKLVENLSTQDKADTLRFLIVFDEVGSLHVPSGFHSLVRAMQHVKNAFFLCADTTSLLPQFAAPDMNHPSFRVSVEGKLLFHPYYLLDTVDQLREAELEQWPTCMTLRCMSKFGRPMWGAMTRGRNQISASELQKLAHQKLVGVNKALHENPTSCLAILLCLLPLSVSPGVVPSNALVAGHLALCTHVTEDRTGVLPMYISEPLVSAQAIRHLLSAGSLAAILSALRRHICAGVVTAGSLGEIISPIFVLMAVAAASNITPASPPSSKEATPSKKAKLDTTDTDTDTAMQDALSEPEPEPADRLDAIESCATVSAFVDALGCIPIVQTDESSTEPRQMPQQLAEGKVNFNHFIAVTYTPSPRDLKHAYVRRAALVAKHEQKGTDRFIPVLLCDSKRSVPFTIQDSDMSVIYIQDKNYQEQEASWQESATSKLSHEYIHGQDGAEAFGDRPYLSIYCQWGPVECPIDSTGLLSPPAKTHHATQADHFYMGKWGCDITKCGFADSITVSGGKDVNATLEAIQTQFDLLREARPDPCNLTANEGTKKRVQQMIPLRYKTT